MPPLWEQNPAPEEQVLMSVGPGVQPPFSAEWWETVLSFNSFTDPTNFSLYVY